MSLSLRGLHPAVRDAAEFSLEVAREFRIPVDVTSAFRSTRQQAVLRRRFEQCVRAGRFPSPPDCRFPANRPGDSAHNFGLAFDSTTSPADQADWNLIRELIGFRVPVNDEIHAEVPGWRDFVIRAPIRPSR